jgi:multidrug efflux pump subunit AcrA (membrane-fusion protein)
MKKILLAFNMLALVALVSCKDETPPPPPPAPEPQVIVTPPPPPPTKEESDGTSISVGSDGVEVSTKDGDKKTVIDVKDGKGKIEIKK